MVLKSWPHYLQGFIHPRWCKISSINMSGSPGNFQEITKKITKLSWMMEMFLWGWDGRGIFSPENKRMNIHIFFPKFVSQSLKGEGKKIANLETDSYPLDHLQKTPKT